jgi:hypothetical protein
LGFGARIVVKLEGRSSGPQAAVESLANGVASVIGLSTRNHCVIEEISASGSAKARLTHGRLQRPEEQAGYPHPDLGYT